MFRRCHIALILWLLMAAGCATWNEKKADFQLPPLRVSPDAIVCETAFARWDVPQGGEDELSKLMDEQILPPDLRRRLADNGLRAGVLDGPLPEILRKNLEATLDPQSVLTSPTVAMGDEILSRREQRQCRVGVREEIEILPQSSQRIVVLVNEEGRVRAESFEQPRGILAITAQPDPDGRVRVELIPAIDHGDMRQRVIGNPGGFRFDARRDQRLFECVALSTMLTPSQTLIVTTTPEAKGLGSTFFSNRFASSDEQLLLLLRLSRGQHDTLFSADAQPTSLVTPLE